MLEALPLVVVVALVGVTSVSLRRRAGSVRPDSDVFTAAETAPLGFARRGMTFAVFTAPGCSTCGPAVGVVNDVAARTGAAVVVIDATRHADLAAAHHVLRVPTTFAVQDDGRILARAVGVPRAPELADAIGLGAHAA